MSKVHECVNKICTFNGISQDEPFPVILVMYIAINMMTMMMMMKTPTLTVTPIIIGI